MFTQRVLRLLMVGFACQIFVGMAIDEARGQAAQPRETRPRARNIGVAPGVLRPGALNAMEEAVYNAMLQAASMTGVDNHRLDALPLDRLKEILTQHGTTAPMR